MAYEKASLKLDMKEVVLVKPSNPTPSSVLSMSTLDNRPDINSLCQTVHVYRSANHDTPNGQVQDPVHVIKEALSKALLYYYPLAGRLLKHVDGKLRVICNADGVPFLEAIANCDLTSLHYLDGTHTTITKHLVFHLSNSQDENGYQYPMVFQVTKFLCGGFTIGMGVSHSICDGHGASQFFRALAELASGKSEPSVKPVWDRERLVGTITKQPLQSPMDEACAAVSPFLPTTVLTHECFKVDRDSIRRLKMSLKKESFTTFESLAAYVWRSRARALKLSYDGKTMLNILVGVRQHLLDSPLPNGYYGNAIVDANVVLTVRELNERPLSEIVKLIKETKNAAFTTDYIRNTINTLETKQMYSDIDGSRALTILSEWKHLGFLEKVDFGWEEPVNIIPAPCDLFEYVNLCIFAPPNNFDPSMKGGVRIFSSLPIAAMPKFREEMEALRSIQP
ncbi:spermidine coumaroyl-CoA acyltransferase-like [Gastrolobium bilobum]|uniref:spermidine coumaroyl-CoA acyltransferase-like n=1 Tax=Gastrolobium bilobum TaxID=150636 RepID=UPI002AB255DA|nr:spermidine coumaroyl-CoA acyltransferase-like [Gastrolobium bilobum]